MTWDYISLTTKNKVYPSKVYTFDTLYRFRLEP